MNIRRSLNEGSKRYIVVGGTHAHFISWCRDNKVSPMQARHVTHKEQVMGLEIKPEDVIRLGYLSPEFEEILRMRFR